jgi:hypothetical protein
MGAEVTHRVKVLKAVEEIIEVSAVTGTDARRFAEMTPGVIGVVEVETYPGQWDE